MYFSFKFRSALPYSSLLVSPISGFCTFRV